MKAAFVGQLNQFGPKTNSVNDFSPPLFSQTKTSLFLSPPSSSFNYCWVASKDTLLDFHYKFSGTVNYRYLVSGKQRV